jgi:hypothetical protein
MRFALPNAPLRRFIRGLATGTDMPGAKASPVLSTQSVGTQGPSEQRGAPRRSVERNLLIRRRGEVPAAGRLMNVSETGAAVRIRSPKDLTTGLWPYELSNGDDVWLTELVGDPVSCWVVAVDHDVLRVRFAPDDAIRAQIRALIRR